MLIAIGDPLSQAKIYEAQLVDELILVNLDRTEYSWPVLLETVEGLAHTLATPLSVGGGVHSFEQVQALLDRGADKVVLNSGALEYPSLINRVAVAYGSQCVVLSLMYENRMKITGAFGRKAAELIPAESTRVVV